MSSHNPKGPYGQELIVSIHDVNMEMNDVKKLKAFARKLVQSIGMKLGPIHAWPDQDSQEDQEKFESSRGISICQFLCESSLTIHFIDQEHKCFINLFSCRPFVSASAVKQISATFGGQIVQNRTLVRP